MATIVRVVAAIAVALVPSGATEAQTLSLEGEVKQLQQVILDDLKKMAADQIAVSYETDRGSGRVGIGTRHGGRSERIRTFHSVVPGETR